MIIFVFLQSNPVVILDTGCSIYLCFRVISNIFFDFEAKSDIKKVED
jgi:hypothetical protein